MSFEDVKNIFRFIDKNGKGEISYDEFTLLTEEKFKGIDPFQMIKDNQEKLDDYRKSQDRLESEGANSNFMENNEIEKLAKLERMSQNRFKFQRSY